MRRLLLTAVLATAAFGYAPSSEAVCAGTVLCGVSGCSGTVNVCPTATSCSGTVSVCPLTDPANCYSSVDVCLGGHYVDIYCGPAIAAVCRLIP